MTIPQAQPIDFAALVTQLHGKGAFAAPLFPPDDTDLEELNRRHQPEFRFQHPERPGMGAFFWRNEKGKERAVPASRVLEKVDLPQSLMHKNRESYAIAFRRYFPPEKHGQWMHQFFRSDFLNSTAMHLMSNHPAAFTLLEPSEDSLSNEWSYKLDAPERRRSDHKLFTTQETKDIGRWLKQNPSLTIAIHTYRGAFMEYWLQFGEAVYESTIPDSEKKNILGDLNAILAFSISAPNFMETLAPAIVLTHLDRLRRHPQNAPELTAEDFNAGMRFVLRNGGFHQDGETPSGELRHMACSAQHTITHMAQVDMQTGEDSSAPGKSLYQVFRAVETALERNPSQARYLKERFPVHTKMDAYMEAYVQNQNALRQ